MAPRSSPDAARQRPRRPQSAPDPVRSRVPPTVSSLPLDLLGDTRLHGRGNGPVRAAVLQRAQQTIGNRALRRQLAANPVRGPEGTIQRLNGAVPANFQVGAATTDHIKGDIQHPTSWQSSTGSLADLADFQTREQVTFTTNPVLDMPAYNGPLPPGMVLAGNVVTKLGTPMVGGGGHEHHSGAGNATAFDFGGNPNLRKAAWY